MTSPSEGHERDPTAELAAAVDEVFSDVRVPGYFDDGRDPASLEMTPPPDTQSPEPEPSAAPQESGAPIKSVGEIVGLTISTAVVGAFGYIAVGPPNLFDMGSSELIPTRAVLGLFTVGSLAVIIAASGRSFHHYWTNRRTDSPN